MESPISKRRLFFLIFIFALILAARLWPLLKFGEAGLGYDTGFYRRNLEVESQSFLKPPTALLENDALGARIALSLLDRLGLDTNIALFGSYLIFSLLLGWAIYLLAAKIFENKKSGFFALFFFALSPVQWLAYTFMFYKQFLAVWLLFLAFYFLEKKSYYFSLPLIFSFASHRTTAFLAIPAVAFWGLTQIIKTRKFLFAAIAFLAIAVVVTVNWPMIVNLYQTAINGLGAADHFHLKTGLFIDLVRYWSLALYYLLPAIFGLWLMIKKRQFNAFFFFFVTCLALVLTKFYFYQRIIAYLDLSVIILAGGGLAFLYEKINNYLSLTPPLQKGGWGDFFLKRPIIVVFFFLPAVSLFYTIKYYQPLIAHSELAEIKRLSQTPNESFIMTYDQKYAPWLYGWAGPDKRIISPGLFWDQWNESQWREFWPADIEKQKRMLAGYHAPLYIFNPNDDYSSDPCFEKFSALVWKFNCY